MIRTLVRAVQPPKITKAVEAALKVYQRGIQKRAPRKSGALGKSFKIKLSGTSGEVSSNLIYAVPQEKGAYIKPHGKALKFSGSGGVTFLRRGVRLEPQPYLGPTFDQDTDQAVEAFVDQLFRNVK